MTIQPVKKTYYVNHLGHRVNKHTATVGGELLEVSLMEAQSPLNRQPADIIEYQLTRMMLAGIEDRLYPKGLQS